MNPERNQPFDREPPEVVPHDLLPILREGATWQADSLVRDYVRRHAAEPAIREAAAIGYLRLVGTQYATAAERTRAFLNLGDADFQFPGAREFAKERIEMALIAHSYLNARTVEALSRLGEEYFGSERVLNIIEREIQQTYGGDPKGHSFVSHYDLLGIAALPIPKSFFQRPAVRRAVLNVTKNVVYKGELNAIQQLEAVGIDVPIDSPEIRAAALSGASRTVEVAMIDALDGYRERFGIAAEEIPLECIERMYLNDLTFSSFHILKKHVSLFPQFTDEIRRNQPRFESAARIGLHNILKRSDINEAKRFISYVGLPKESVDEAVRSAIRELMNSQSHALAEGNLRELREKWNVPERVFQEQAEECIRMGGLQSQPVGTTWETARRIQGLAKLPEDRFEEAFIRGQVKSVELMRSRSFPGGEPNIGLKTMTYWRIPGMTPELAKRLEQRVGFEYMAIAFSNPDDTQRHDQRRELPFLDSATIRLAAVEGMRRFLTTTSGENPSGTNAWLRMKGLSPVAWADVRAEAIDAAKRMLRKFQPVSYAGIVHEFNGITDEDRKEIADSTRDDVRSEIFFRVPPVESRHRELLFGIYGFSFETLPLKVIPTRFLIDSKDPVLAERAARDPWHGTLAAIQKLQGRSANEEHDPWVHELDPLVRNATNAEGVLDRESEGDGALLVEFIKTFGMLNLPNVSRAYFRLKKKSFDLLPDEDKKILVELVGQKATRMGSENLINEMRKLRFSLQTDLLRDVIPRKIGTTLGEEIFLTLRGSTRWDRGDRPGATLKAWNQTVEAAVADGRAERVTVAPGYEETSFAVAKAYRPRDGSKSADEEIEKALAMHLGEEDEETGRYPLGKSPLGNALSRHVSAVGMMRWATNERELLERNRHEPGDDDTTNPADSAVQILRAKFSRKKKDQLELPSDSALTSLFDDKDDGAFVAFMEMVAETHDDEYLLALSALHVSQFAPANLIEQAAQLADTVEAEVRQRAEFTSQYLKEHYLNPTQDPGHVGHAPFSETLRLALERAWHAEGDETSNPILAANARVNAIRARQTTVSTETVDVALVPVQGPLRIYAGDIGDACYSSQHDAMARGEYPNVRAMIFVTNRGKPKERMVGSFLLVETRLADTNERAIVLRANNPRQNLVAQLDAPSLVRQTVDAAIATARRRKIKHVGVVRDRASAASSNRESVSAFYQREYKYNAKAGLIKEPETNFNGYPIWNDEGSNPTVIVWSNEDPEAT